MRIVCFYHICLLNHYEEIVKEYISVMDSSGLYEVCEEINVCCLGTIADYVRLKRLLESHPKYKIVDWDAAVTRYEFITLKYLKKYCDTRPPFYGFYSHGKGISWPRERDLKAYNGGTYWRAHMNFWNIIKWQDNIKILEEGYDMSGVKLLIPKDSPSGKLHYSGNYFFFKSDYIKTVPPIETLNQANRFEAEFWACSGHPRAYNMCDTFVDYNQTGRFVPPTETKPIII